jgi:Penicillinase repressor
METKRGWRSRTTRTLLDRLVKKGALRFEVEGKRYLYWPRVTMEACVRKRDRHFHGISLRPAGQLFQLPSRLPQLLPHHTLGLLRRAFPPLLPCLNSSCRRSSIRASNSARPAALSLGIPISPSKRPTRSQPGRRPGFFKYSP